MVVGHTTIFWPACEFSSAFHGCPYAARSPNINSLLLFITVLAMGRESSTKKRENTRGPTFISKVLYHMLKTQLGNPAVVTHAELTL